MYDRLLDLLIENQFASRSGGDKSGRRKGIQAVRASKTMKRDRAIFKIPPSKRTPEQQASRKRAVKLRRYLNKGTTDSTNIPTPNIPRSVADRREGQG